MPEETVEILLKVRADQQAAQATAAALAQHQRDIQSTMLRYKDLGTEADRMSHTVENSFARMGASVETTVKTQTEAVKDLIDRWKEYGTVSESTADKRIKFPEPPKFDEEEGGPGGGGAGVAGLGFLRRTGSTLGRVGLGSVGQPLMVAGEIAQVTKGFERLGDVVKPVIDGIAHVGDESSVLTAGMIELAGSEGAVLAAALPVTVAIIAVAAALKGVLDTIAKGESDLKAAEDAQRLYYETIQQGTTESIKKSIQDLKDKQAVELSLAEQNNAVIISTYNAAQGDLIKEAAAIKPLMDLHAEYDKNKASADAYQKQIDALTKAMNSGAVAANDLKAAAEAAWAAEDKAALAGAEATRKKVLENLADDKLSVEQVQKKSQDLKDQRAALEAAWGDLLKHGDKNSKEVQDQLKAYSDAYNDITAEITKLDGPVLQTATDVQTLTDKLKADDAAIKERGDTQAALEEANHKKMMDAKNKQLEASNKGTMDAEKQLADDKNKLADAWLKREADRKASDKELFDARQQAAKENQQAEESAVKDRDSRISQINSDWMQSEIKATADFAETQKKEDSKFAKDRARALEDLSDNLLNLAAKGDVDSFIQAQKAGEKKLRRMDEDEGEADQQRAQEFVKQREESRKQRAAQIADVQKTFEEESQKRKSAYRDQLQALDDKHRAEQQAIEQAFVAQVAQLESNFGGLHDMYTQYYSQAEADAQTYLAKSSAIMRQIYANITNVPTSETRGEAPPVAPIPTSVIASNASHTASALRGHSSYAVGGDISSEGWIYAHPGEHIARETEAKQSQRPIQITMNNTVGDVYTQTKFDAAKTQMITEIAQIVHEVTANAS